MISRSEQGFSLFEVLVTLAVIGMALSLVLYRGPARSPGLDQRLAAGQMAEAFRGARARAVASNRTVSVLVDTQARALTAQGEVPRELPPGIALALRDLTGPSDATQLLIVFAPDGSSTGGAIDLLVNQRRIRVTAAWLGGRVSIADVP